MSEKKEKSIILGFTMKGISKSEEIVEKKDEINSLEDLFLSPFFDKKTLEILFYSNSLREILGKDYLTKYSFDDIYGLSKNFLHYQEIKNKIFLINILKKTKSFFKKNLSKNVKFEKQDKNVIMEESLFSFDISIEKPLIEHFENLKNQISNLNTSIKDIKNIKLNDNKQLFKELESNVIESMYNSKKIMKYIFILKIFDENLKYKFLNKGLYKKNKFDFLEITKKYNNEIKEKLYSDYFNSKNLKKLNLPQKEEFVKNLKHFISLTGFVDNNIYSLIENKYQEKIEKNNKKIFKLGELIKFISGNIKYKKELFKKLAISEKEKISVEVLLIKVDKINKLQEQKIQLKKELKNLKLKKIIQYMDDYFNFKYKLKINQKNKEEYEKEYKMECKKYNKLEKILIYFSNIEPLQYIKSKEKDLIIEIIKKIKENKTGETIRYNDEEIDLGFENKIKNIVIEQVAYIINILLKMKNSETELKEKYNISILGYLEGKKIFNKDKTILYSIEKGSYGLTLYGNLSNLFSKIQGIGIMNIELNWKGEERLKSVKFLEILQNPYYTEYFQKTLIKKENIYQFKSFKERLFNLSKKIGDNYKIFDNMIIKVTRSDFVYFSYIKLEDKYFITDGERSVLLSKEELLEMGKNEGDKKGFIDSIYVNTIEENKISGFDLVDVSYIDDKGNRKKTKILTNLKQVPIWFEKRINNGFLGYYCLYFKDYLEKEKYFDKYKGMIIYDLETVGFGGNIILSYFLFLGKLKIGKKKYDCITLKKYSNPEYKNFFDNYTEDTSIESIQERIKMWVNGDYYLSGHNILHFDNKKLVEDVFEKKDRNEILNKMNKYSLDTLEIIENQGFGKLGLSNLSKINFDFGKNIGKSNGGLMEQINQILNAIKKDDKEWIKKNKYDIKKFVFYNKNDVLMSMCLIGQMLKYGKIATPKGIVEIDVKEKIKLI